ncbi:MAG: antirestriction protein ArdA [Candidatus Pacebacteria bacterium]|nr:antirestriction protein ArdA [Candidatus Paceibacterota bacterium]
MQNTITTTPKIYVACLADYNNGRLHGRWIDADQDADSIYQEIYQMMLESSCPNVKVTVCNDCGYISHCSAGICGSCDSNDVTLKASSEEWAIHDYEGFEGLSISEYESIEDVAKYAQLIEENGEAFAAYANNVGIDYATKEGFEESYQGEWDSEEAFAENLADVTMEIPERLSFYFDYEKFARELFMGDYYSADSDKHNVYVFLNI